MGCLPQTESVEVSRPLLGDCRCRSTPELSPRSQYYSPPCHNWRTLCYTALHYPLGTIPGRPPRPRFSS